MVTYFAKRLEDLPVVRKIGDIVRVHRSVCKDYKGVKQFSVNLGYNSSWCLFHSSDILRDKSSGDQGDDQYSSSGSDEEMEAEGVDPNRSIEKSERKKYTPYKFSGKSYSFDLN
jgi:hypothetical protein